MTVMVDDGPLNNIRIHESILTGKKKREEGKGKREEREEGKEGEKALPYNKMPANKYRRNDRARNHHLPTILVTTHLGKNE